MAPQCEECFALPTCCVCACACHWCLVCGWMVAGWPHSRELSPVAYLGHTSSLYCILGVYQLSLVAYLEYTSSLWLRTWSIPALSGCVLGVYTSSLCLHTWSIPTVAPLCRARIPTVAPLCTPLVAYLEYTDCCSFVQSSPVALC